MANHPRPAWQLRTLRWSAYTTTVLLLLALISWLALPSLVKKIAAEQTLAKIGRKLDIGEVSFNPFILALRVHDVTLYEPDQKTAAFSAKELVVNASATSLPRLAAILDEVKLVEPRVHVVRLSDEGIGRYNFSDIIDRILAMPKSEGETFFSLANLQLQNGAILFDDKVTGKTIDIRTLNIGVPFVSNLPRNVDTFVQPVLSMTVNGTPFSLKGRSKPFASSLDTTLAIDINKLDLASYVPFVPVALPVKLESAKLTTQLDLTFSRDKDKPQIALDGDVTLADISVQEKNAAQLLKAGSIAAKINKLDLVKLSGVIDQITIDKPEIWAEMNNKGEINWTRIGKSNTKPAAAKKTAAQAAPTAPAAPATADAKPAAAAPAITVRKLMVRDGSVKWTDDANAAPRQVVQLEKITVDAEEISTVADAKPAKIALSLTENGHGEIGFTGEVAPLKGSVNGNATLKSVQLSGYQNYLNRSLNGALSGKVSGQTEVQVAGGQVKLGKLGVEVSDLKLASKAKSAASVIGAKTIALDNASIDLQARKAEADTFRIAGLNGDLRRDAKGVLNLQDLLATSAASGKPAAATDASAKTDAPAKATTPAASNTAAWQAKLHSLAITDSTIAYEDGGTTPPQKLRAEGINLKVDNLSSQLDQTTRISLQTKLNKNGKLNVTGQAAPQLKTIDLALDAQNLPIAPFQTYFTDYLNVTLTSGTLSTKGKLALTPPVNKQTLALQYNGSASLNNFRVLDKLTSSDFLRWRVLNLQGINAKIDGKPVVSLEKIALSDFYARAILSDQGKLNLQDIVVSKDQPPSSVTTPASADDKPSTTVAKTTTSTAPVTPAAPDPNAPVIRIGQTVLQGGNINFTDNFVKPNYTANMTGMGGTIGSIASDKPAPATIDLRGKIDNDAPLQISGALNPLFKPMFLDVKASANGVQLPRLTPYSAKYAGYPITKGKLSMDVQYKIENDKLVAQNDVRIEQLTFGDHVDGPNVTKLPVMLAVSLLKDRNGTINLNLPISGSLSDPQFSIGGIIMRVFVNLIVKAVTSPFALISSMFGGDSAGELSYIEFEPGSSELTDDIRKKLDTLGYALHQRPALKIDVMGRADPAVDDAGLRQELLNRKMRAMKRKDIIEKEGQPSGKDLDVTEGERTKYMEKVYKDEKFKKPRNMVGLTKSLPPEEMQKLIVDNTTITEDDLRNLAQRRADLVRNYLQDQSIISADRIYLIAPKLNAEGIKDKGQTSRVELTLQQ
ncbi:DUF748 domain-containing protein [Herbaspirillum rhizosphaerae]|uniref:DUF748 domain-containing protein n=1 Tax=Herbaspirillum rhizosphaerae TaxID=346179 RepID=UPI00067B0C56|nr:DUF748 domain-containing protein [Herbaspirillum rhizosphaerae]